MFEIIFLIAVSGYFIISVLFIIGASKKFETLNEADLPAISIIVAARNEEENILKCLTSLDQLIYHENKIEIIIVDDNSTDNTGKIITEFIASKKIFKKILSKIETENLRGKANAIASAVEIARGEIILTTDADCEVPNEWAKTIASYYTGNVGIVNGFTTANSFGYFSGMQSIDYIYLLTAASAAINLGFPVSCLGNNMSFRKKAYLEAGGFENISFSVTEDFKLLHAINKLEKYKIIHPLDMKTLVTTEPNKNFKELAAQKKRWAVGGSESPIAGLAIMCWGFLTNVTLLLSPLFFSTLCLYLAVFKISIDYFLLYPVHKKLGLEKNLKHFLAFQIYYILYVITLPFVLLFNRKVKWKGRKY